MQMDNMETVSQCNLSPGTPGIVIFKQRRLHCMDDLCIDPSTMNFISSEMFPSSSAPQPSYSSLAFFPSALCLRILYYSTPLLSCCHSLQSFQYFKLSFSHYLTKVHAMQRDHAESIILVFKIKSQKYLLPQGF